jgi:Anti-sigma factor NepR
LPTGTACGGDSDGYGARGTMMKERKPPDNLGSDESMDTRPNSLKKGKGQAALGRDIQAKIGQQLRSYYDTLIEPTPDRFADLLRQLEKPSKEGSE